MTTPDKTDQTEDCHHDHDHDKDAVVAHDETAQSADTTVPVDPGAWPENPEPGTPAALHKQLTDAHNQGQTQHPTHIPGETEHRDRKP